MVTAITEGIRVSVETRYEEGHSLPENHVFTYKITIENNSQYTIQLLRRHWYIYDADGHKREVEGEGVIGQQPIIEPGQAYTYSSGCNLGYPMGKMVGNYLMERCLDGKKFKVQIPEFVMMAPFLLN
ncbi:MAG: Co2+/Mg2+ efflux protein ApaG [Flammeovirgaceae bacterium]|nr:Co2+/Mg2+ efflux protein ApaG [Flammeovirgaceae bacterium]MDW8288074.1 Co2+/Mg2+ efflux protein ApaG [Flammeovirgaceae bacterium]